MIRKNYTSEEDKLILNHLITDKELGKILNRTYDSIKDRRYYLLHKEKYKEYSNNLYKSNPNAYKIQKERNKIRFANNPELYEKHLQKCREYRNTNEYRLKNKYYMREYRKNNPKYREQEHLRHLRRKELSQ